MEIGLVLIGLLIGPWINYAIYAFAYFPRPISPWQLPPDSIGRRALGTKIPIIGWLMRFREAGTFGRVFWIRPLLIELLTPIALVYLYRFVMAGGTVGGPVASSTLTHQFWALSLLFGLMIVSTFIDFDERTIPDWITLPGTLLGLLGSVMFPDWRLQEMVPPVFPAMTWTSELLHANSPFEWPLPWNGSQGLFFGALFWSGWCFGMADRRWITRRGFEKAIQYFFAGLKRSPSTRLLIAIWVVGMIGLVGGYWALDVKRWESLLSSLFGIGLGGILVWGFRLVARLAMGQEALGFGDVTLMAMIGSFFGWQIVWLSFFIAPFFGLAFVLIVWAITRDRATPFGPYLCAATAYALLDWHRLWGYCATCFLAPQLMLLVLLVVMLAFGAMLWMLELVKMVFSRFRGKTRRESRL
jgi:leader peptidase (prepilin peptidase) / N-methyltransferase